MSATADAVGNVQSGAEAPISGQSVGERIRHLKERDNVTNIFYLGRVYLVIIATIGATIAFYDWHSAWGLSAWWDIPVTLLANVIIGASQHQLGGATHEATHFILFKNRMMNELISDWFCMFPLYSTTFQFRNHHLSHHQFVNDPDRDLDIAQLRDSGHWLDFPIQHIDFLRTLLRQLWLPNLVRYTLVRARYNSLGVENNPYADPDKKDNKWLTRVMVAYAVLMPPIFVGLIETGSLAALITGIVLPWAAIVFFYARTPEEHFPGARIQPVISHKVTAISRITFLCILYSALSLVDHVTGAPAWGYYALLWVLPLFTSFALFMILRQVVQHGNADRGRLTNTRVFLVNPLIRYAVFPFGMDYHLPHHLYASVPHYKLKTLHETLEEYDSEYADRGVVVEGYFHAPHPEHHLPTVLDVLGPEYVGKDPEGRAYTDSHALDDATVKGREHLAQEEKRSRGEEGGL